MGHYKVLSHCRQLISGDYFSKARPSLEVCGYLDNEELTQLKSEIKRMARTTKFEHESTLELSSDLFSGDNGSSFLDLSLVGCRMASLVSGGNGQRAPWDALQKRLGSMMINPSRAN